jgi:hypothetical protein
MSTANLLTKHEIIKQILIEDYCFCGHELYVLYEFGSKQIGFIGKAESVAPLLKKAGLIEDWTGSGNEVAVEVEFEHNDVDHEGNHRQIIITKQLYWLDSLQELRLSQKDIIELMAIHEYEKAFAKEINKIKSIPNIIRSLLN